MLVFNINNKDKATFDISIDQKIKPVPILDDMFILQDELESLILNKVPNIIYNKRKILKSEFITQKMK